MRIVVLNGSPKGDESVTMQYVEYIKNHFKEHTFEKVNISHNIKKIERNPEEFRSIIDKVIENDIVLWAFPVYYLLVPSQYKRFIELIFENNAEEAFEGKYTAVLTTSIHYHDTMARDYMNAICDDLRMNYLGDFLSSMEDLLDSGKRQNLIRFAERLLNATNARLMMTRNFEPVSNKVIKMDSIAESIDIKSLDIGENMNAISDSSKVDRKVIILADRIDKNSNLEKMVAIFQSAISFSSEVIEISEIGLKGGCLGCLKCGYNNECSYKDGMQKVYFEKLHNADSVILAGTIRDRFLSYWWKMFFDRSFFRGHTPFLMGKLHGAIISGPLRQNTILRHWLDVFLEDHINNHVGVITDEYETTQEIVERIKAYASDYEWTLVSGIERPETYNGTSSRLIFRDFVYLSKGIFRADHKFYKKHKFYDFPQKNARARIGNNIFLRAMMSIKPIRKQIQRDMKHHMISNLKNVAGSGR